MDKRKKETNRSLTGKEAQDTRLLALYLQPQRFGFAVFKGPRRVLDWGTSSYASGNNAQPILVYKRVSSLLTIYAPSVIVARNLTRRERRHYGDIQPIVGMVRTEAKRHSAKFALIGREEIRHAFRQFGKTTKYDIAAQVAIFFPELMWKLPPPRKFWQKEHHNMAIFDAASLGITHFSQVGGLELNLRSAAEGSEPAA